MGAISAAAGGFRFLVLVFWALIFLTSSFPFSFAREMAADRPDATESPITVEPGKIQIESSMWSYTRIEDEPTEFEAWAVGETNIKFGLTTSTDIQFVIVPYANEREETPEGIDRDEGLGDIEVRLKWNLWGNDKGDTALALLPFVKIPTGTEVSNDQWEGGLIVPFAWDICERLSLGLQVEVDRVYEEGAGHFWAFGHTAVLGTPVTDRLGVYVEYAGIASERPYEAFFSTGLTYRISENFMLDVGALAGLNSHSDDINVFQGFTWRF